VIGQLGGQAAFEGQFDQAGQQATLPGQRDLAGIDLSQQIIDCPEARSASAISTVEPASASVTSTSLPSVTF
jgi:hypothetical protein